MRVLASIAVVAASALPNTRSSFEHVFDNSQALTEADVDQAFDWLAEQAASGSTNGLVESDLDDQAGRMLAEWGFDGVEENGQQNGLMDILRRVNTDHDFLVGILEGFFTGPNGFNPNCVSTIQGKDTPSVALQVLGAVDTKKAKAKALVTAVGDRLKAVFKECQVPAMHAGMVVSSLVMLANPVLLFSQTALNVAGNSVAIASNMNAMRVQLKAKNYRQAGLMLGTALYSIIGSNEKAAEVYPSVVKVEPSVLDALRPSVEQPEAAAAATVVSKEQAEQLTKGYLAALGSGEMPVLTSRVIGAPGLVVDGVVQPFYESDVKCMAENVDAEALGEGMATLYDGLTVDFPHGCQAGVASFAERAGAELARAGKACNLPADVQAATAVAMASMTSASIAVSHGGVDLVANGVPLTYALKGAVVTATMSEWEDAGEFLASLTRSVMGSEEAQYDGRGFTNTWGIDALKEMQQ